MFPACRCRTEPEKEVAKMWEKQAEAQTILKPQKENGKRGLPGGKPQEPLLFVQLLLCVAAVAFAVLAKSMDAVFFPQLSQAVDGMLSQGVDFSQENTFAHFAAGMVEGLRESARAVMARLDGAAQSTPAPASAQGGYLPAKQADDPPEGFSLETYGARTAALQPSAGNAHLRIWLPR